MFMLGPGELVKFWHSWFEVVEGETQKTVIVSLYVRM